MFDIAGNDFFLIDVEELLEQFFVSLHVLPVKYVSNDEETILLINNLINAFKHQLWVWQAVVSLNAKHFFKSHIFQLFDLVQLLGIALRMSKGKQYFIEKEVFDVFMSVFAELDLLLAEINPHG